MNGYVDIHSHILPNLDDGAKNIEMSVEMVKECIKQGISTIICTPHYIYSHNNSIESFIKNRNRSYQTLKNELNKQNITEINFRLAAEVNFNCDLSSIENIEKLAIEGTDYILIEMPNGTWQDGMFDYLYTLIAQKNLIPIIAHTERYYQTEKTFKELENLDVFFQVNAPSFLDNTDKKNALKLLKNKKIHLIGTDTHNLTSRAPQMQKGIEYLRKRTSDEFIDYLIDNSYRVLNNEEIEKSEGEYTYQYHKKCFFKNIFRK